MSIYTDTDLPYLERLHDDLEDEQDPAALLITFYLAELGLIDSLQLSRSTDSLPALEEVLPAAAYRHWKNFMMASVERSAHFMRFETSLDVRGKRERRARRLAPPTSSFVTTDLPDWCRASAATPPCGSVNLH